MSFASGADHQASSAIISKQTLMSKIYTQSHFVQMLQTVPVSSNFEVIIMFTRQFANNPWINDENESIGILVVATNFHLTSQYHRE